MRHRSIVYPVCRVDLVELEPGESFRFSQKAASASYGVFALGGTRSAEDAVETTDPERYNVTKMTEGAVAGRMFNKVGQWVPNDHQNGWSNDGLGHESMTITAGAQGARWICLGRVAGRDCEIQPFCAEGEQRLPVGWGALCMRGRLVCAGKSIGQMQFFGPKETTVPILGNADALLIY